HVTAAGGRRLESLRLQPVAERYILRVSELRCSDALALEIGGGCDRRLYHEERAAGSGTRDDADRLSAGFHVRIDRRVRPHVRGVERIRKQRCDFLGTGRDDARLQMDVRTEIASEDAFVDAH